MASGIFAILDDIAILMDDVVMMSKLATKKTAGILGDDLAVNAEKATGFISSRELPVLWAITKGSFINKLIILPIVFLLNFLLPILIKYILIVGGLYLAYEGVHKIFETFFHKKEHLEHTQEHHLVKSDDEKEKISSAVKTDFILSLEIVIIALGTVLDKSLTIQILTVSIVALLATVGVYGFVALIVRMDDLGLFMIQKSNGNTFTTAIGNGLIRLLPYIIRMFSVVGTIALILVAGGIFVHYIDAIHHYMPHSWPPIVFEALVGLLGGTICFVGYEVLTKVVKLIGLSK